MEETIIKAAILVSFIFCGYTLKQLRLFGRSTFNTISTIVFNITLPSVIIVNLNGRHLGIVIHFFGAVGKGQHDRHQ